MKYKRKVAHTRQQIMDSFLNNLSKYDFETITVDAIVKPIFLNRSTFYRYFDDKYDLLNQLEQQILQAINQQLNHRSVMSNNDLIDQIALFCQSHAATLKIMLGSHGPSSFEHKLKTQMWQHFKTSVPQKEKNNLELKLLGSLSITMVIHVLKESLLEHDNLDVKSSMTLLYSVVDRGIYKTVENSQFQNSQGTNFFIKTKRVW